MGIRYCASCLTSFADEVPACPNLSCGRDRPEEGWGQLLGEGDLLDRHYRVEKVLALAGAGATYQAREVDAEGQGVGPLVAVKVLYASRDTGPYLSRLSTEAQILRELDHPHIVELQAFVHRRGRPPYLVTTFEHGGDLSRHVRSVGALPASVAAGIVVQILLALDQAHRRGVIHRDLKPQNILLRQRTAREATPRVRVADFGIAKITGGAGGGITRVGAFVGTPEYAAPEQFLGDRPSAATDIFAAGGLLHYLVTGHTPVRLSHRGDAIACFSDIKKQLPIRLPPEVRDEPGMDVLQRALDATLRFEPEERWAIGELVPLLRQLSAQPAPAGEAPTVIPDGDGVTLTPNEMTFLMPPGEHPITGDPETIVTSRTMVPTDTPAPAQGRTMVPGRTPPPAPPRRMRLRPPADPNALSLEDLFASPAAMAPAEQVAPSGMEALFGGDVLPVVQPAAELPEALRDFPSPASPAAAPARAPEGGRELLRLLGSVALEERSALLPRFAGHAERRTLLGELTGGADPRLCEGACTYWLTHPEDADEGTLRRLLRDREPRVREVAAHTLGKLGSASCLSSLGQLCRDKEPAVRAAAAVALGRCAARHRRQSMAQRTLKPLARDPDRRVQRAYREAWVMVADG